MKMFKYIFFAGAVCTAAFLAGCNEDEYTPGEASSENGLNVYFESPTGAEVVLGLRLRNLPLQWEGIKPMKPFLFH